MCIVGIRNLAIIGLLATALCACSGSDKSNRTDAGGSQPALNLEPPSLSVAMGNSTKFSARLSRAGLAGEVTVAASNAPAGLTISDVTIAADDDAAEMVVEATNEATLGEVQIMILATASEVVLPSVTLTVTVVAADAGVSKIGEPLTISTSEIALSADGSRVILGTQFDGTGGENAGAARIFERNGDDWTQIGQDLLGEAVGDLFGRSVDISADGTRVAIGAYQNDGGAPDRGHVRIFDLVGDVWTQVGADIDPPDGSGAGAAVRLTATGNRVVIGAPAVNATDGRAFVYEQDGGAWVKVGQTIVIALTDELGTSVAISDDGDRIAVGVPGAGVERPGFVKIFDLAGDQWVQKGADLVGKADNDTFGSALALSASGEQIAISGPNNKDGGLSGGGSASGHVRVFELANGEWTQRGQDIVGGTALNGDNLGESLSLSADGNRVIVSAASNSIARIYDFAGGTWTQKGIDLSDGARAGAVAISPDGKTAAVGYVNSGFVQFYSVGQ